MTQIKNIIVGILALTYSIGTWFMTICLTIAAYNIWVASGYSASMISTSGILIMNNVICGILFFVVGIKLLLSKTAGGDHVVA